VLHFFVVNVLQISARKYAQRAAAGLLALWLSGAVFLVLCHGQDPATSMEFCPLAKMGAHCHKADKNAPSDSIEREGNEQGFDCCAFIPAIFDKGRDIQKNPQLAPVAAAAKIEDVSTVVLPIVAYRSVSYQTLYLSKNNTFLKNCTFRI
jgi:hypothetical protein